MTGLGRLKPLRLADAVSALLSINYPAFARSSPRGSYRSDESAVQPRSSDRRAQQKPGRSEVVTEAGTAHGIRIAVVTVISAAPPRASHTGG
jgi:hypothetical protein